MRIDLHNHTIHSDGVYTAKELIEAAVKNDVDILALTDHDSVFGIKEIFDESKNYNVKVIAGMELSTFYKDENVHIVTLFKNNIIPEAIYEFSLNHLKNRRDRALRMMQNVEEIYGLKYDRESLLSQEVITRGNMLRNLMKSNNMTKEEAWQYLSSKSKAYIPSGKLSTEDGLKFIRENNGVAILAHPGLMNHDYLEDVLKYGFDGIEVYYPLHNEKQKENFLDLAKKYNLAISGGSDCHGDNSHAPIGTSVIDEKDFEKIAKMIEFRM